MLLYNLPSDTQNLDIQSLIRYEHHHSIDDKGFIQDKSRESYTKYSQVDDIIYIDTEYNWIPNSYIYNLSHEIEVYELKSEDIELFNLVQEFSNTQTEPNEEITSILNSIADNYGTKSTRKKRY